MEKAGCMPSHCNGEAGYSHNLGGQGNGVVVPVRPSVGAGGAPAVAKEEGTPAEGMVN